MGYTTFREGEKTNKAVRRASKLIFGATTAVVALIMVAGPAQALPNWHVYRNPDVCEDERQRMESQGTVVDRRCEYVPGGSFDGSDGWVFYNYTL